MVLTSDRSRFTAEQYGGPGLDATASADGRQRWSPSREKGTGCEVELGLEPATLRVGRLVSGSLRVARSPAGIGPLGLPAQHVDLVLIHPGRLRSSAKPVHDPMVTSEDAGAPDEASSAPYRSGGDIRRVAPPLPREAPVLQAIPA